MLTATAELSVERKEHRVRRIHLFLLVAVAWSGAFWWSYSLSQSGLIPYRVPDFFLPLGGFGLLIVAAVFAFADGGLPAVGRWLALTTSYRHSPRLYLAALLPASLLLVAVLAYGQIMAPEGYRFSPVLKVVVLFGLLVAWVEEVVWRGYALPRLLETHSLVQASLILSVVWLMFHLPLYFVPGYNAWGTMGFFAWAPFYIAFTFFLSWLGASTRYSVLLPMLSHYAVNWAVAGHEPRSIENVAALLAAALLALTLPLLYRKATFRSRIRTD